MSAAKPKPDDQTPTSRVLPFPKRSSEPSKYESKVSIADPSSTQIEPWHNAQYRPSVPMPEPVVIIRSKEQLEKRFKTLVAEWREDTAGVSSSTEILSHEAYKRIYAMGEFAIPFILRELQDRPEHWDYALWLITGENPVPQELAGQMDKIADIWVAWGKNHNYI